MPPNDEAADPNAGPKRPRSATITVEDEPAEEPAAPSPSNRGPLFRAAYDGAPAASLNTFFRDEAALQADGTLTIATKKGWLGSDPQPAGYYGGSFYNGGTFRYATVVSPVWSAKRVFDRVTPSFEALTPPGTWIEVRVSAHIIATGEWTKDYSLGVWADDADVVRRHSVGGQKDATGDVITDTLELASPADALQVGVLLFSADGSATPRLRAVSASTSLRAATGASEAVDPSLWGTTLAVPAHAQGAASSASPAAMSMLLGFWSVQAPPSEVASMTSDVAASGNNRVFDTACVAAAAEGELHAMVTRLASLAQIERLVASGIPVAIGLAYDAGQLDGAPLESATSHTVVVKGFTAKGGVQVNDPAFASDDAVETTYDRAQLTAAWMRAGGTTYVIWPATKKLPVDPVGGYW